MHTVNCSTHNHAVVINQYLLCMQGGYDLKALGDSVADSFRGLLKLPSGDKFSPDLLREEPLDAVKAVLREVRNIHNL